MKNYALSPSAKQIFDKDLLPAEWQAQSDYMYLASCCLSEGYSKAAKYFFDKAMEEHGHFKRLVEYMQSRGVEAEVPKTTEPEVDFTDLKSAIAYRMNMESDLAMLYDRKAREMFAIDLSAYSLLMEFLKIQTEDVGNCMEQWKIIERAKEDEDQQEFEALLFSDEPKVTAG